MELIKDLKQNDCGEFVGTAFCKCFGKNIEIIYDKDLNIEFVINSIEHLNSIYPILLKVLCKYTVDYCKDFMNDYPDIEYDYKLKNFKKNLDILDYIQIDSLRIESDGKNIVLNISAGCDWAEEKGLQWIIKDSSIVYVGPWYDFRIWTPDLDDPFFNYCTRQ